MQLPQSLSVLIWWICFGIFLLSVTNLFCIVARVAFDVIGFTALVSQTSGTFSPKKHILGSVPRRPLRMPYLGGGTDDTASVYMASHTSQKGGDEPSLNPRRSNTVLPQTGSPVVDRIAKKSLPDWMHQMEGMFTKDQKISLGASAREPVTQEGRAIKERRGPISRSLVDALSAMREMGVFGRLEEIYENLDNWFLRKIIKPLHEDIVFVTSVFQELGWDHLSPCFPAALGLLTQARYFSSNKLPGDTVLLNRTSNDFTNQARPQSLLELIQKYPQDPVVSKRLRIERYLSIGVLAAQRNFVIEQVSDLIHNGSAFVCRKSSRPDTVRLYLHFFCTFMDDNLPGDGITELQPFTSRHFIPPDCPPSNNPDALQIQQLDSPSTHFRVISSRKIYDTFPGDLSLFASIIYLVELCHRFNRGYLGVANLASSSIELVQILDS